MSVPQTLLAGRYRLVRVIAGGGMGVVWEGWDERLQRPVAIKELRTGAGVTEDEAEEAKNRAMREARITARLHHPHAVPVFDAVEHEGRPCLIMQYLPSTPMSAILRERLLTPPQVARVGAEIASALAAAHRLEIVHRDVKPGNVLIDEEGDAHISDFGISHALGDATLTRTGMVYGTPAYLAPEVARGGDSTFASDVFSLGSTLYAALEGEPPFGSDPNSIALLHRVATGNFPSPANGGPLTPFLLDMLSLDPKERPSMKAVASLLAGLEKGLGSEKPTLPIPPVPDPATRVRYGGAGGGAAAGGRAAAGGGVAAGGVAAGAAGAAAPVTGGAAADVGAGAASVATERMPAPTGAAPEPEPGGADAATEEPRAATPAAATRETPSAPAPGGEQAADPSSDVREDATPGAAAMTSPTPLPERAVTTPPSVATSASPAAKQGSTWPPSSAPAAPGSRAEATARVPRAEAVRHSPASSPAPSSPSPSSQPTAPTVPRRPAAPAATSSPFGERKLGRRGALVALLLVSAAVLAALFLIPALLPPSAGGGTGTDPDAATSEPDGAASSEADEGGGDASAQPAPSQEGSSEQPSEEPEAQPAPEDRDQATTPEGAVAGYYALLPEDTDGAWERLTPNYQSGEPIDKAYFDEFWGRFSDVTVSDVAVVSGTEVEATVTYVYNDGSSESERRRYVFVEQDGILKIDRSTTL